MERLRRLTRAASPAPLARLWPGMPGGRFLIRLSVSALRRRPVLGRPRNRNGEGGAPDVMTASPERSRDHRIADEQAALGRGAALVARAAPPGEGFAAGSRGAGGGPGGRPAGAGPGGPPRGGKGGAAGGAPRAPRPRGA